MLRTKTFENIAIDTQDEKSRTTLALQNVFFYFLRNGKLIFDKRLWSLMTSYTGADIVVLLTFFGILRNTKEKIRF